MKTEEEYDELLKEFRTEIATRLNLSDAATNLIPLVHPVAMRHYANGLAEIGATKPDNENANKANGAGNTDGKLDPAKINRRVDMFLDARYKVPGK